MKRRLDVQQHSSGWPGRSSLLEAPERRSEETFLGTLELKKTRRCRRLRHRGTLRSGWIGWDGVRANVSCSLPGTLILCSTALLPETHVTDSGASRRLERPGHPTRRQELA